jgi:hypothetical protein
VLIRAVDVLAEQGEIELRNELAGGGFFVPAFAAWSSIRCSFCAIAAGSGAAGLTA